MHPVFVLFLIVSLLLPAVPVSGCECGQKQSSLSNGCCCSKSASKETQKQKSCCCQASQKSNQEKTPGKTQIQCQKQSCHCQQTFSQPATLASVKSTELAQQLRCCFQSIDLMSELALSDRPASPLTLEMSAPALSYSSGEFCAHFCLWLI
jgi:hypothetical protein